MIGGHFDWTQKAGSSTTCADNDHPAVNQQNTAYICWHTPKLTAFNASNGDPMLDNTAEPLEPRPLLQVQRRVGRVHGADGSTLYVGGEFTKFGGTWYETSPASRA